LHKKDYSGARVEFNRALDRQRWAKEFFSESIAKEKEDVISLWLSKDNPLCYGF